MALAAEHTPAKHDMASEKVQSYKMVVTPEIAQEWLDLNSPNRNLSPGTIEAYARRMAQKKWKLNGEAVIFAKNGAMLNGQHRCHAAIKAQMPFETIVVRGVDPDAQQTMDDPRKRSVNDQQKLRGLNYPASASAAARWLLRLRLGSIAHAKRMTNAEVLDVLEKHPGLGESAQQLAGDTIPGLLPSVMVAVHYLGSVVLGLQPKADSFVGVMATGVPAYEGDPAHLWREKLIRAKAQGNGLAPKDQWEGTVHAWNLFVANEKVKRFQIPDEAMVDNLDLRKI